MDDGSPELAVGFAIDFGDSFAELLRLNGVIDAGTANAVKEFAAVQRASKGMLDLGGSTAQMTSFGGTTKRELESVQRAATATGKTVAEATRDFRTLAREKASTERQAESLIRQLDREAAAFGKTKEEIRAAKGEHLALTLAQQGNTEGVDQLIAATRRRQFAAQDAAQAEQRAAAEVAAAIEVEARAVREAAFAHQMFEAKVREGVRAMREQARVARESQAATQAQAAAADRLKASIDPAYAAQQRFNREMAEARTLISAGAISLDDYVAKLRMEQTALDATGGALGRHTKGATANRMAMQGASYQVQDFATQVSMGANPINAFAVQGAQLAGQFSNIEGKAGNVARFFMGPWGLAITFGLMALGPLVGKLLEGNDALDDAVKKLKKDAAETDISAKAKDRFRLSQEGVAAAIRDGTEATQKSIEAQRTSAEQENIAAQRNLRNITIIREKTAALLAEARATMAVANSTTFGAAGGAGAGMAQVVYSGRVAELLKLEKENADLARQAEVRLQVTRIDLAVEAAKRLADPTAKITKFYADQANAATKSAHAQIAKGRELTVAQADQLALRLAGIERQRDAEMKDEQATTSAAQAASRAAASGVGVDRFRSREQAIEIAGKELQRAGMRVDGNSQFGFTSGHANDSDHNRFAIDVNVGKGIIEANVPDLKSRFDTLAKLYQSRGYDVIWNKQFYAAGGSGPGGGAKGHDNHLHIKAPATIVGKATLTSTASQQMGEQTKVISDQQREYEAAMKATDGYVAAQMKSATETGKTAKELRQMEDALQRLAAPTEAQKVALDQAAAAREAAYGKQAATDFQANVLQPMRDELALIGLVGPERAAAALELERQAFIAKNMDQGIEAATARWQEYYAVRKQISDAERNAQFDASMADGNNRLAELREELRLVGATDDARVRALATLKATQEATAAGYDPTKAAEYVAMQVDLAVRTEAVAAAQRSYNDELSFTADKWDLIAQNVQNAASGMADAFGKTGRAIGDMAAIYADYRAQEERARTVHDANMRAATTEAAKQREIAKFGLATSTAQVGAFGDMASAAKGFFKSGSDGYAALATAEKIFRAVEFAMSVRAMAQDAIETGSKLATAAARTAANAVEAVTKAIASLPFPANIAAGAATVAALAAIGVSVVGSFGGGGKNTLEKPNEGAGTVLGDASAKSDSIKNAIDALKEVDTLTNNYARQMASSLRSIESQIGGIATLVVRAGDVDASAGVATGFKANAVGSVLGAIPVIGGMLKGLFGTSTKVIGGGLYGGAQSLGSILDGGFDASTYSDVEKKKKLFGFTTGTKYSTQYGAADGALEAQFGLLLRQFNDAIVAAAGPLGAATGDIQNRLNGFVVNIGKIDLKDLTGQQIQEKLSAIFGAAADGMANAAFPGLEQFQKVGEGAFETLVRVASTVEAVSGTLDLLGQSAQGMGIAAKVGLANQFDSISGLTDAADAYFQTFYSQQEQATAKSAQLVGVFASLGLTMPASLASFRALVEAQDLNTAAGQATYATLLKLAPAFADLQASMEGAKSAADILSERTDLERRMLELQGNAAAIRALDLAKLDQSNRPLQQQIWALQDGQEAAKAADELRKAWVGVGDTIMDEVKRIRGLSDAGGNGSFASLMGRFNTATAAARGGDMDAAKGLPGLSQALLSAAALVATSRQELDRVRAQTAASLEATNAALSGRTALVPAPASTASILEAASTSQSASAPPAAANDDLLHEVKALREEVSKLRTENTAGHAATAANTGKGARILEGVTAESGGGAIAVASAA